ncbi:MAG: hypothetical protein ABI433_01050 [Burkholderiaceae bacterium]
MSQFAFGTGSLWGAQTQDANGNVIANLTPIKFGEVQDVGIDMSRDIKLLHGQLMMPVAVGGGKMKIDVKAKFARVMGRLFSDLFFGQTLTGGTLTGVLNDTTGAAIPTTPFTITVVPPSAGVWVRDLGVVDSNGLPFSRVASAPTTGQYSVAAGVYTFAAADVAKQVFISYTYTATSALAKVITMVNLPMGFMPTFGMDLAVTFNGKQSNWRFPNCAAGKLAFDPKQDDFTQMDLDISVFADAAGNIGTIVTSE